MKSQKTIILMGSQGSGKGTQARNIRQHMEEREVGTPAVLFSMGERFRQFAKDAGYTEDRVRDSLNEGKILPVFFPIWLWTQMFIESIHGNENLVFDGSPRTVREAEVLESAFEFYGRESVTVLKLEVSRDEIVERLMRRGRVDDTRDALLRRVSWYEENSHSILDFFESNSRYSAVSINGEQEPHAVFDEIKAVLETI